MAKLTVHLLVHVGPVLRQLQLVSHVGVVGQGVVEPVSEGDLLLLQDGVNTELSLNLLPFVVGLLRRLEGFGDVVSLERLAELGDRRM